MLVGRSARPAAPQGRCAWAQIGLPRLVVSLTCVLLGVWLVAGSQSAASDGAMLRILPDDAGCVTFLTNRPGGLYRGCPERARIRAVHPVPDAYPIDIARNDAGLWLLTRQGVHLQAAGETGWQKSVDRGGMALDCAQGWCCSISWSGRFGILESSAPVEPETTGLPEAPIQVLVASDQRGCLAGSFGRGLFRLPVGDSAWRRFDEGMRTQNILSIDCDQGHCLAGTWGDGLYQLAPGQTRWMPMSSLEVERVSVVVLEGSRILAQTDRGIMRSGDRGRSWAPIPLPAERTIAAVALSPGGGHWLGDEQGRLYFWRDGQAPRVVHAPGLYRVSAVATHPSGAIHVVMGGRLFHAADESAKAWQVAALPFDGQGPLTGMTMDRTGRLVIGTLKEGLFCLADGQAAWAPCMQGLPPEAGVAQLHRSADGAIHLVTAGRGDALEQLFRWDDEALEWQPVVLGGRPEPEPYRVRQLAELPGGILVASGTYDLLWKRPEEQFWRQISFARTPGEPPSVDADGRLWVERGGFFSSNEIGQTQWQQGVPPAARWQSAVRLDEGRWLAQVPAENRLVLLAVDAAGRPAPIEDWPVPMSGTFTLSAVPGGPALASGPDGLYRFDPDQGVWKDITPLPAFIDDARESSGRAGR
ncbi:MAG: hypothetical protein ACLFSG_04245 [Halothiobacillaceae bacterium]